MAGFSRDVVASAFNELAKDYETTFDQYIPAWQHIAEKAKSTRVDAKFYEWTLVPEGVGTFNEILDGDQDIEGGRRQSSVRARAYVGTYIYAWDVPWMDFRHLNSKADVVKLIKNYPERSLIEMQEVFNEQFVMGNRSEIAGFTTLNGDTTYNPMGLGAESGLLSFAPLGSQTGTVHGVTRNSIVGWANQHQQITSFQANGRTKLREAYYDAEAAFRGTSDGVDVILADPLTFANYIEDLDDMTILQNVSPSGTGDKNRKMRRGVPFLEAGGTMYREHHIDLTQFSTTSAQQGVAYGLNTTYLSSLHMGADPNKETDGQFALREVGRIPTKEVERWEYVVCKAIIAEQLRCHFTVTGGALS